jgi:microcompartment protein CcmL/EutN
MNKGNALGVVELSGISKGFLVQDAMLKSSNVEKIIARTICSGKYMIIVRGEIGDVQAAIDVANEMGSYAIVNTAAIPNLDPQVFPALAGSTVLEKDQNDKGFDALLILETFSVVTAIKAADYAAKTAELNLMRIHAAMALGGKGMVVINGDQSSLEAALQPTVEYLKEDGMLADFNILNNPHADVLKELM